MRNQSFIVTTKYRERVRRFVWNNEKIVALDHPAQWLLEKTDKGIFLKRMPSLLGTQTGAKVQLNFNPEAPLPIEFAVKSKFHAQSAEKFPLRVHLSPVPNFRPAYIQKRASAQAARGKGQYFVYWGTRYHLIGFKPVGQKYIGAVAGVDVFSISMKDGKYQITSHVKALRFKHSSGKLALEKNKPINLSAEQLASGMFEVGRQWWRINFVASEQPLTVEADDREQALQESSFTRFSAAFSTVFALVALGIYFLPSNKPELKPVATTITLQTPKILPPELKPEPPKPKKPEPKKVELKPKAKPEPIKPIEKPKAKPVVAKPIEKPKSPPMPKAAPPKPLIAAVQPKPAQVAVAPPPPPPVDHKKQVADSLNFLSSPVKTPTTSIVGPKASVKYGQISPEADKNAKPTANPFADLTKQQNNGVIQTQSSRAVSSKVSLATKGMNDVQGRVDLHDLYASSDPGAVGDSLGTGLRMTGAGKLDPAEIEKALAKHLAKFQFCYEKSLLSAPNAKGTLVMGWTITDAGGTADVKTVRSELNQSALHECVKKELQTVKFPAPKGGAISLQYPFKFSSSAL